MALVLTELKPVVGSREELTPIFDRIAAVVRRDGGELIEIQIGAELKPIYMVAEHADPARLAAALSASGEVVSDVAEVRLVGATLDQVKASRGVADYLVEWDLPATLTMDTYLARKREKSPLYAKVPEVRFLRTYVREDMAKCLCLYDAPDEEAVCRARAAVETPFDRVPRLAGVPNVSR